MDTAERITEAAGTLFRRQGMSGTGLKQIGQVADAALGSIYHFFPGGKDQLVEDVVRRSGIAYGEHAMAVFDVSPDLPAAFETAFAVAARALVESNYAEGCPIATIALEVADTNERLRVATADVFTGWIEDGGRRLPAGDLPTPVRRRLIIGFITGLEGAFILSRALRTTEPLEAASRMAILAARVELAEHAGPRPG